MSGTDDIGRDVELMESQAPALGPELEQVLMVEPVHPNMVKKFGDFWIRFFEEGLEGKEPQEQTCVALTVEHRLFIASIIRQQQAALGQVRGLAEQWQEWSSDTGCHKQWRDCRATCATELRTALATAPAGGE